MNNETKTKDIIGSCSSGIPALNDGMQEPDKTALSNASNPIAGSSAEKAPTSPTYVATIRTPMDHQIDSMSPGMNDSLTGLETADPRAAGRLDQLKSRGQELSSVARERMGEMTSTLSHHATAMGHTLAETAGETREKLMDSTQHMTEQTRTTLRSNPTNSMLMAAGIGLALGFILNRRR